MSAAQAWETGDGVYQPGGLVNPGMCPVLGKSRGQTIEARLRHDIPDHNNSLSPKIGQWKTLVIRSHLLLPFEKRDPSHPQ